MDLGQIDYTVKLPEPELWLTDPRKNLIAKITNRSGTQYSRQGKKRHLIKHTQVYKANSINEMEFSLPFLIEIEHELVRNPLVDQIKESSLIRSLHNNIEEFFTIIDIKRTMDATMDYMTISCRSLGYELMRQNIRNFKVVAQPLSSLLNGGTTLDANSNLVAYNGLLSSTLWKLDQNYDISFDTIFRDIDISKATILNAIIQVAKTFGAIISYNTINRTINFQQLKNVGFDKDARISFKNYLKSYENETQIDVLATRIIPAGKNNLTIAGVSPNGQIYYDNFDFYTAGYTTDIHGNVLTHSNQNTSDSLCAALISYKALLASSNGTYASLLSTLNGYRTTLANLNIDMAALVATLASIEKNLDYAQQTGGSTTTLLAQQATQNSLISAKQTSINTANADITATQTSITTLQATLSTSANFTPAQIQELIPLIRSVDWEDLNITDAQQLYNQMLIEFEKYRNPQIQLKIDMVNIFKSYSEQRVWDKFWICNDVTVEYDVIGSSVKAKIWEISFDHVEENMAIVVSSVSDLLRNQESVANMLYQAVSSSASLSVNVDNWNQISAANNNINALYNNGINSAKMTISGGNDNNITINNRGLTSTISTNPNSLIRLNGGVLGFSADGGTTFTTAVSASGIYAPAIVGQLGSFVTLNAASITAGTMTGINLQIGTSPNLFLANTAGTTSTSGISLGATTWAASPFRVNYLGAAWATSMTLTTPSITNGTIDNGSGTFHVTAAGVLSCTGAVVNGTITATGGTIGGWTINSTSLSGSGTISGGTITGSIINTSSSGTRIELSSSSNLLTAYGSGGGTVRINPTYSASPALQFTAGIQVGTIYADSSNLNIGNAGGAGIAISCSGAINLTGSSVTLNGTSIASINSSLTGKTNVGSTTSYASVANSHNHGIPDGTVLMKYDGTPITWVAYAGSAPHSHTTN